MNKALVIVFVGLAVCVLALAGATACVVASRGSWGVFESWNVEAKRDEAHDLALESGGKLVIELPSGSIRIASTSGSRARVSATVRAFERNGDEARKLLDRTRLAIVDGARESRVRLERDDSEGDGVRGSIAADLEIELPDGVALEIGSASGSIEARGDFAAAKLQSRHGSIKVAGVRGGLDAQSQSGTISAEKIEGEHCFVQATHGTITLSDVRTRTIEAKSSSGTLRASGLRADSIDLAATHGRIDLADVEGELRARSASGSIAAERLSGSRANLVSTHGPISVRGSKGALELESSSGRVEVEGAHGPLRVKSSHGSVEVDGVFPSLTLAASSGSISVRAREGSTLDDDWSLQSTHGKVDVELPRDAKFEVDARATHGDVDVGFEMLVPAGKSSAKKGVFGSVNGGGKRLTVTTSSGSISIQPLR